MKNWTFVSSRAMWLDQGLSVEAKVLWSILSCFRDVKNGECYPTIYTLRMATGYGRNRIVKATNELDKLGCIQKRTIRERCKNGFTGSKVIYVVRPINEWVAIKPPPPASGVSGSDMSGPGRPVAGHITVTSYKQLPVINNNRHRLAPVTPLFPDSQSPKPAFKQHEIEHLLDQRGYDPQIASFVFDEMERCNWSTPSGADFDNYPHLTSFVLGKAEAVSVARTGFISKQNRLDMGINSIHDTKKGLTHHL